MSFYKSDNDVIIAGIDVVCLQTKFHSPKRNVINKTDNLVTIFQDFKDSLITSSYSKRIELQMFKKCILFRSDIRIFASSFFNKLRCFKCLDGTMVISRDQVCNKIIDCSDLSDECLCDRGVPDICNDVIQKITLLTQPG